MILNSVDLFVLDSFYFFVKLFQIMAPLSSQCVLVFLVWFACSIRAVPSPKIGSSEDSCDCGMFLKFLRSFLSSSEVICD